MAGTLANIFMCSFEYRWLRNFPNNPELMFFRGCIDDIFAKFSARDNAKKI